MFWDTRKWNATWGLTLCRYNAKLISAQVVTEDGQELSGKPLGVRRAQKLVGTS